MEKQNKNIRTFLTFRKQVKNIKSCNFRNLFYKKKSYKKSFWLLTKEKASKIKGCEVGNDFTLPLPIQDIIKIFSTF